MVPTAVAAAEVMLRIRSVVCFQHCEAAAAAAVVAMEVEHETEDEVVAVATESSSIEMTEEGEVAACCSVLLVSIL